MGIESNYFGKTEPDNEGLRRYQLDWDIFEVILNADSVNFTTNIFLSVKTKATSLRNKFFKKTTLPVTKNSGIILYKYNV